MYDLLQITIQLKPLKQNFSSRTHDNFCQLFTCNQYEKKKKRKHCFIFSNHNKKTALIEDNKTRQFKSNSVFHEFSRDELLVVIISRQSKEKREQL